MKLVLWVALGGALGAVARYLLSGWVLHHTLDWKFPLPTFLVNVAGCLVIGFLAGFIVKQDRFSPDLRLFLLTGLLGGFTTFSAFGLETFYLLKRNEFATAAAYVALSVFTGLAVLWIGFAVVPSHRET